MPSESWVVKREWNLQEGNFIKPLVGLVFPAGSKVVLRLADVSDTDTNVSGEWHYDLIDD